MKELVYARRLLAALEDFAARPAIRADGVTTTFAEHGDRVLRLVDALRSQLEPGDRFAVLAPNGRRYLELHHAAMLGAGVIAPLNARLSAAELAAILRDARPALVFCDSTLRGLLEDALERGAPDDPPAVVALDDAYEALLASGDPHVPPEPDEGDPALLMYTGGTTGRAKGVVLSHRAQMLNVLHVELAIGFDADHVHLHQTPMFHAAAIAPLAAIPANGAVSVFAGAFEPARTLDVIESEGVTQTILVPTMIALLFGHPAFRPERLASLRSLVYGAAPMPPSLITRLRRDLPALDLAHGYGMTEACTGVSVLTAADHRAGGPRVASVGRPLPGVQVEVRDPAGGRVGRGEVGELWARGGNFMDRYWDAEEESAEALVDGWYRTGDLGYADDGGYLFLVDRAKDLIITGGENVYSTEVERVLEAHPAVAQVAVIGIPHDIWGEQVHAVVVPKASVTADELIAFCRARIAAYKTPKSIELRAQPLPLSGAMKVLKHELRTTALSHRLPNDAPTR